VHHIDEVRRPVEGAVLEFLRVQEIDFVISPDATAAQVAALDPVADRFVGDAEDVGGGLRRSGEGDARVVAINEPAVLRTPHGEINRDPGAVALAEIQLQLRQGSGAEGSGGRGHADSIARKPRNLAGTGLESLRAALPVELPELVGFPDCRLHLIDEDERRALLFLISA